ncbi:MAG: SAM-dependent methyltransferase, partial [Deltaproteobacteria bacterium]
MAPERSDPGPGAEQGETVPSRVVHEGDAFAWLEQATLPADWALVTSIPDLCEVPRLGEDGWRDWFMAAATLACRKVADESVAIFFQTDVKRDGRWIDKSYLVQRGAESAGSHLLWRKVVCRAPAGTVTFGRPAYAHLLCFSRGLRLDPGRSSADVLPRLGE